MSESPEMSSAELKERGNSEFKDNDYTSALASYTQALQKCDKDSGSDWRVVLHKNKAACHLKLDDPAAAAAEASKGGRIGYRHSNSIATGDSD